MDTKKTSVGKKIGLCAHNLSTIRNAIVIITSPLQSLINSQSIRYSNGIQKL